MEGETGYQWKLHSFGARNSFSLHLILLALDHGDVGGLDHLAGQQRLVDVQVLAIEGGAGGDVLGPRVYTGPWVLGAPGSGHSAPRSSGLVPDCQPQVRLGLCQHGGRDSRGDPSSNQQHPGAAHPVSSFIHL